MNFKQWLYKTFCKVDNKPFDEPVKSNLSEPFITFFEKVKSGEITWTVTDERIVNKQDLRYVTDREIYTFIIDENISVKLFRSSTDCWRSMWQSPEIFNYDERKVLSEYVDQYERNKIKMEKEKAIQTERDKLSIALGIPIDKSKS
jgi:hypothetical protein